MAIADILELATSHAEIMEFGVNRIRQDIDGNTEVRIPITVPHNKVRVIFRWLYGDITANVFNFRWDHVRNVIESNLLLGTEQLNFDTRPFPYLIMKSGGKSSVVVNNTGNTSKTFEMTYHYFDTTEGFISKIEKYLDWKQIV